MQVIEFNR